jgi:hypothetical protein
MSKENLAGYPQRHIKVAQSFASSLTVKVGACCGLPKRHLHNFHGNHIGMPLNE